MNRFAFPDIKRHHSLEDMSGKPVLHAMWLQGSRDLVLDEWHFGTLEQFGQNNTNPKVKKLKSVKNQNGRFFYSKTTALKTKRFLDSELTF